MRLLNVHEFPPPEPEDELTERPYAILSHTWEDDELVFSDLQGQRRGLDNIDSESADKVRGAQKQAAKDRFDYIWIDTLCIDKSSSAELGEAINSMYRWYQSAEVCYVYLADLDGCPRLSDADIGETSSKRIWSARFRESKWFKRGWTLQELIAPKALHFYDKSWNLIGTLADLAVVVSEVTGIHLPMLRHQYVPEDYSIAQRMSWAAYRETSRPEDQAYSLLGILDLSISIRYGEGTRAFERLQEALIGMSADQSLFAWERPLVKGEGVHFKALTDQRDSYLWRDDEWTQLLAPSPDAFATARDIIPSSYVSLPYRMTNMGLHITSPTTDSTLSRIVLNCHYQSDPTKAILLNIECEETQLNIERQESHGQLPTSRVAHVRLREREEKHHQLSRLSLMDVDEAMHEAKPFTFYIARSYAFKEQHIKPPSRLWLQLDRQDALEYMISEPSSDHHINNLVWTLPNNSTAHLKNQRLVVHLSHTGIIRVEIQLELNEKKAILVAASEYFEYPGKKTGHFMAAVPLFALPLERQLKVATGHAVDISLHRNNFNGQDMYILRAREATHVRSSKIKSFMRLLKGPGMNNTCGIG